MRGVRVWKVTCHGCEIVSIAGLELAPRIGVPFEDDPEISDGLWGTIVHSIVR